MSYIKSDIKIPQKINCVFSIENNSYLCIDSETYEGLLFSNSIQEVIPRLTSKYGGAYTIKEKGKTWYYIERKLE